MCKAYHILECLQLQCSQFHILADKIIFKNKICRAAPSRRLEKKILFGNDQLMLFIKEHITFIFCFF